MGFVPGRGGTERTDVDMTGESSRPREALDKLVQPFLRLRVLGVKPGDGAFEVKLGEDSRGAVTWTGDEEGLGLLSIEFALSLDEGLSMRVGECESSSRAVVLPGERTSEHVSFFSLFEFLRTTTKGTWQDAPREDEV